MQLSDILGSGMCGIVLRPPIECGSSKIAINENYIGKISYREALEREYDFLLNYVKLDTCFSRIVTENDIDLCPIEDIQSLRKKYKIDEDRGAPYQLIMPYLGNTFDRHLERFNTNRIMSVQEFKNYFFAIQELYEDVKTLNSMDVYHNDIKTDNLIYTDTGKLLMIDFDNALIKCSKHYAPNVKFYTPLEDKWYCISLVLIPLLEFGFANKTIYESLVGLYRKIKDLGAVITVFQSGRKDYRNINVAMAGILERIQSIFDECSQIVKGMSSFEEIVPNANVEYKKYIGKKTVDESEHPREFTEYKNRLNKERQMMTKQDYPVFGGIRRIGTKKTQKRSGRKM